MSRAGDSVHRTFYSLSERNFRLYFIGQVISASGTWMNATASAWLVFHLSDSGTALGINTALLFLPILVLGAYGGVIADRFDKRRILLWTQASFVVISLTLWVIVGTGVVELWMVYLLSFLNGLVTALDNPTRQSFYAELVGVDYVTNAVSLNSAAFTGARMIGPALAAVVIATIGLAPCFLFDGLSYIAVITALLMMKPGAMHAQRRSTRGRGHLMAGLRYIWETDELRQPLLIMSVVFAMSLNFSVLLPLLAHRTFHGGVWSFGELSALAGLGSLLGAITLANRAATPTLHRLGAFATATGIALFALGFAPTLETALLLMVPLGFAVMAFMITANTILQVNAKPQARGRVMALYGVVFLGSTPIGAPIAGWLGQHGGPRLGLAVGGVFALGTGLITLAALAMRKRSAGGAEVVAEVVAEAVPEAVEAETVPASVPA
jgi:MFS family permease